MQLWLFRPTTPATSTVTGRVTRADGGQSVANARIEILQFGTVISSATSNAQGSFTIPTVVAGNLTIRVTANNFVTQSRNLVTRSGSNVQNFSLISNISPRDGGRFTIGNFWSGGAFVLDLAGGHRLIGYRWHNRPNQIWEFTFVPENNTYLIRNVHTGRFLYDNRRGSGAIRGHHELAVGTVTGVFAQWRVTRTNNGPLPYVITNVGNGRSLDVALVHGVVYANRQRWWGTYPFYGGPNQRFSIVRR